MRLAFPVVAHVFTVVVLGGIVAVAFAHPAAAKHKKPLDDGPAARYSGEIVFTVPERALITGYFASRGDEAAPRGKPLPPGIAKKLARGGSLPPGIAKRYLPRDLDVRLPPPPIGVERVIVGRDVLLIRLSTGAILDMIRDALR